MNYDVLVIGGGHAGVEAAVMARRLKMKVAIVTFSVDDIGENYFGPIRAIVRPRKFEEDQIVTNIDGTGVARVEYYEDINRAAPFLPFPASSIPRTIFKIFHTYKRYSRALKARQNKTKQNKA